MNLTQSEIVLTLDKLNINKSDKQNGDWLFIRCPFHVKILGKRDNHIGNCSINLNTGIIHCFACHHSEHISILVRERLNLSYRESYEYITGKEFKGIRQKNDNTIFSNKIDYNLVLEKKVENKIARKEKKISYLSPKILQDFDPQDYHYTKIRGFTKEFCKKFNIKKCIDGYYKDYFIIPIIDNSKKFFLFEARKLLQYEKELISENKLSEFDKQYLKNKKVLYPFGAVYIKHTLFNIDNLNKNKDLWISEGIGTIPKIYLNISKNVTCTFGSEISEEQIKYLYSFKNKKIIIPDNDEVSLLTIEALNSKIQNLYVIDIKSEDKDNCFIGDIKKNSIIEASRYLLKQYKIL